MSRPFIANNYKSLRSREGHEVRIDKWLWNFEEVHLPPDKVRILKDYPRTVLFELEYAGSFWGLTRIPPRKIRKMVTKAVMATGEVAVIDKVTGERLTGQNISKFIANREEEELCERLMKL